MKLSEFKQLIKQSILEEKEKEKNASGPMTPEEEEMVADYEREQDAKHTLDNERPMEEAMVSPDNRVDYLAQTLQYVWNMGKGSNTIDFKDMAGSLINDMFNEEPLEEAIIREAEEIVAAWAEKQTLNEEMHGGYLELFEMNPNFEEGVAKLLQAWNEWKEGPETEPGMIEEAKHDILAYLSSMLK